MLLKYPKIIDVTSKDIRDITLPVYHRLGDLSYTIQEKLKGTPVQMMFSAGGGFTLALDQNILKDEETPERVTSVLKGRYAGLIRSIRRYCGRDHVEVNLFGILISEADYGVEDRIYLFDMALGEELVSTKEMIDFLCSFSDVYVQLLSPRYKVVRTLEEALSFDPKVKSIVSDVSFEDEIAVGIVIKPYEKVVKFDSGIPFIMQRINKIDSTQKAPVEEQVEAPVPSDKQKGDAVV